MLSNNSTTNGDVCDKVDVDGWGVFLDPFAVDLLLRTLGLIAPDNLNMCSTQGRSDMMISSLSNLWI